MRLLLGRQPLLHQAPVVRHAGVAYASKGWRALPPLLEPSMPRRASFRMPSDETLRVALVCTLPLLHFSPSLVAVVHLWYVIAQQSRLDVL